jgi:hypothetical protein
MRAPVFVTELINPRRGLPVWSVPGHQDRFASGFHPDAGPAWAARSRECEPWLGGAFAALLQFSPLGLGFFQDRDVSVGIFPESEEVLIRGPSPCPVTRHGPRPA